MSTKAGPLANVDEHLRSFWRRAVHLALGSAVVASGVLYLAADAGRALALGLLLGAACSVARFELRYRTLARAGSRGALVAARLVGYALSALALGLAFAMRPGVSPWTTAAGLLTMNVAVILADVTTPRAARNGGTGPGPEDEPQD